MPVKIKKSSGDQEFFDFEKLLLSLTRSGAPPEVAKEIGEEVAKQLKPSFTTNDIYRLARKLLRHYSRTSGMRYSLKKALFSLGPSGYPFEKYVGRILKEYGYKVEVGKVLQGYCVQHEVDVLAYNGREQVMIECKYHSDAGKATDVKVALYIHSRFLDLQKAAKMIPENHSILYQGWLVTNTRCTSDAKQYAECMGIRIVSWRYPDESSLEKLIEDKRLYPVSILPSARKKPLESLFANDVVLAQDIADMDMNTFARKSGLDSESAMAIKKEADELCPCTRNM